MHVLEQEVFRVRLTPTYVHAPSLNYAKRNVLSKSVVVLAILIL